jgi:RHS repeat-associated protein
VPEPQGKYQPPMWCQPDVNKAMERAWARTQNGTSGNEAGFVLNGTPSNYKIVDTKSGNTKDYQSFSINNSGPDQTFLLFHVHPNRSTRKILCTLTVGPVLRARLICTSSPSNSATERPRTRAAWRANDGVRQKFTQQERDNETGLDYMHARSFASAQGRFSSADTVAGSMTNPQTLNLYACVQNNPLTLSDPTGHIADDHGMFGALSGSFSDILWTVEASPFLSLTPRDVQPRLCTTERPALILLFSFAARPGLASASR